MEPETTQKLEQLESKIDAIWVSVEKMRKYMLITAWVTIAFIVLPLLASVIILPWAMSSYMSALGL